MACHCDHCQHEKTQALIRRLITEMENRMSEQLDRLGASLTGLEGDVSRLTQAATNLQSALDQALAEQEVAIQDAVNRAVEEARAEFEAAVKPFADRAAALDEQTPEPTSEPDPEPTPDPQPEPEPEPAPEA